MHIIEGLEDRDAAAPGVRVQERVALGYDLQDFSRAMRGKKSVVPERPRLVID